jgi:sensor domain CHASE-containing protein
MQVNEWKYVLCRLNVTWIMVAMVTLILVILYALIEKILRSKDEGKEKQQQYNHEYKDNIKYRPKY